MSNRQSTLPADIIVASNGLDPNAQIILNSLYPRMLTTFLAAMIHRLRLALAGSAPVEERNIVLGAISGNQSDLRALQDLMVLWTLELVCSKRDAKLGQVSRQTMVWARRHIKATMAARHPRRLTKTLRRVSERLLRSWKDEFAIDQRTRRLMVDYLAFNLSWPEVKSLSPVVLRMLGEFNLLPDVLDIEFASLDDVRFRYRLRASTEMLDYDFVIRRQADGSR